MPDRTVKINEFNVHNLPLSTTMIVLGSPGTGKTSMIEDLAYKLKHRYPVAKVWSGSEDTQGKYSTFIKPLFVSNEYKAGEHEYTILRQKLCKAEKCNGTPALYIMDDCNTDKSIFNSSLMKNQFKNMARWGNSLFVVGSHYIFDMPPDVRKCVGYVAIFKETSMSERKKIYENFAVGCSFQEFCDLMDQLTGDHTCLVFNRMSDSNKMEDCIFYFKADLHKKWTFGCKEYNDWNESRYNKNYVETYAL